MKGDGRLAVGVVAVEFAAAVQSFVASTLLPVIAPDLHAAHHLGLLVAGSTIGMFTALPVAGRIAARLGPARALGAGMLGWLAGLAVAVTATNAWVFGAGQFASGSAGGLLAVFAVSAVIRTVDERMRVRVIAASSAMWIVPSLVGPAAALGVEHLVGWRVALLLPVPFVIVGRSLLAAAATPEPPGRTAAGRALLVPVGAALIVCSTAWPATVLGTAVAAIGVPGLLPDGTLRLARGAPAALVALVLFALGWFGADRFVTILLTAGYGVSLGHAAIVLSAAPLGWAVTSLVTQRLARRTATIAIGLGVASASVAVVGGSDSYVAALIAWTCGGIGIGLAYPGLYLRCTLGGHATELATAVITAEAFGSLVGPALGGAVVAGAGLAPAYTGFAVALAAAAALVVRTGTDTGTHVRSVRVGEVGR